MSQVQVEQKSCQMPPQDGFTIAHFLTVSDIERSARFYETVFEGHILSGGDSSGAPGYIQIANTWLIVNVGGGPDLTLSPRGPCMTAICAERPCACGGHAARATATGRDDPKSSASPQRWSESACASSWRFLHDDEARAQNAPPACSQ